MKWPSNLLPGEKPIPVWNSIASTSLPRPWRLSPGEEILKSIIENGTLFCRVLAENSGVKPKEVIAKLYAAHSEGKTNMGFDIEGDSGEIKVL